VVFEVMLGGWGHGAGAYDAAKIYGDAASLIRGVPVLHKCM